jgi:putative ABC transport system permease protein
MLLALATKSLRNRALTSVLTLLSIAFSVALLVGIENVRAGMRDSFAGSIRGTDLIVGARGGTMQLLLYSVFGLGSPTGNLSYETYRRWNEHPAVAWTIPYSLGDSHHGYRVIGTTDAFYERYRYRDGRRLELAQGRRASELFDVVLGAEAAQRLGYSLGARIAVTHGMGPSGIMDHSDTPFRVVGILARTFTAIDRALYVTLEGVKAIHIGWEEGAPPSDESASAVASLTRDSVRVDQVTSFFLGTKNRLETLRLQRDIATDEAEPLTAIIPGVALGEMWRTIGYAEDGLRVVSTFVVVVGLLGMLVSLYTSLAARRREMSVLRAIGASPRKIVSLLVVESGLLSAAGALVGVGLVYLSVLVAQGPVEATFGLHLPVRALGTVEYLYLAGVVASGTVIGLVPAYRAYRNSLADGLSVRL